MTAGVHAPYGVGPTARLFSRSAGRVMRVARGRWVNLTVRGQLGESRDIQVAHLTGARR